MTYQKDGLHLDYDVNPMLYSVRKVCTTVMANIVTDISYRSLLARIRKVFRKNGFDIEIKSKKHDKVSLNEFYVNAYYDYEADDNNDCAIEIIVYHNIEIDSIFARAHISQFICQIYDAVIHELKHQMQSQSRKYKPNPYLVNKSSTMSYLGDPDEIDAYALSIAIELIRALGKTRATQYLHRASRLARIRPKGMFASSALYAYYETFGDDTNIIIKKLIKKVYLHLQSLDKSAIFY